jgi:hypothetical protein
MSHHIPWCGCDPNHLPTHARGKYAGCKFNEDPKEVLIRNTEEYLYETHSFAEERAMALLRRWIDLNG